MLKYFYNFIKKKYFKSTKNWNLIFSNALAEVYKNPFMLHIVGVYFEQCQIENINEVQCTIYTKRPGLVIGRYGKDVDRLEYILTEYIGEPVKIKIEEI